VEAYRLLSDPVRRASYDRERAAQARPVNGSHPTETVRRRPESERRLRMLILTTLYHTRRNSLGKPGLNLWVLSEMLDSTLDEVQFSVWYLRGKKLIETDGDDAVAITVAGVDYVEENESLLGDLLSLPEASAVHAPEELPS